MTTPHTPPLPDGLPGGNVHLLPQTAYLRSLHTVIRDRHAPRDAFVSASERIMRILIEAGLNLLPFEECEVSTPVGERYAGLRLPPRICGVSVVRAGESMEGPLRAAIPSVCLGKILMQRDRVTKRPRHYLTWLPDNIADCHVLLLEPMLATGGTAVAGIRLLLERGVAEDRIVFVNLITVPEGIGAVVRQYPGVRIVTSAIDRQLNDDAYMLPGIGDFGDRYFGTDARGAGSANLD